MKTPDFDDLLAAFDIPDMVDPKAAIESGHQDDHDGHPKQPSGAVTASEDEAHNSSNAHDGGVSVIVKNVRNMDTSECGGSRPERNGHSSSQTRSVGNGLHNGHAPGPVSHYKKNGLKPSREEGPKVNRLSSTFNQFSPISSVEKFDDDEKIEVDDLMDKPGDLKTEDQNDKSLVDSISKPKANRAEQPDQNNNVTARGSKPKDDSQSSLGGENHQSGVTPQTQECPDARESSGLDGSCTPKVKTKYSTKLSSCIAAIAALSAKKATIEDYNALDFPATQQESVQIKNPKSTERPQERKSGLELAKKPLLGQPDSPSSVTSDDSSKGSPSSNTDSTPVIPKVRIKTIKTSSGQIKRTVTRVLPELDPESLKRGEENSCLMASTGAVFSSPTRPSLPVTVKASSGGASIEITKQMTIKPVGTAFLPVSAVKTAGSQVINLKLANNTTVKATVIPASSMQSASSAILKAANAIQQQTVMVPASSLANAKLVPKAVHFSNINLLSQTVSSASCDLPQVLFSKSNQQQTQQVKQQTGINVSKKVSRVQVFTSSQSSVVDAFNKVLSSMNPVPMYVPNLSPPTLACISLPSRGYKCLECGDSFALEKSLTQHYERRSVRIEVTCNHCGKNLVFFNKCSLLSHARSHKDKGVVMQCSHLILKPIPADQMISTLSLSRSPAGICSSSSPSNAQTSDSQTQGKVASGDNQAAVISAPCGGPSVAAMPLEDDASKLYMHNLKCLECNETFQDDNSLAMHYQVSESNSQVRVETLKTLESKSIFILNVGF